MRRNLRHRIQSGMDDPTERPDNQPKEGRESRGYRWFCLRSLFRQFLNSATCIANVGCCPSTLSCMTAVTSNAVGRLDCYHAVGAVCNDSARSTTLSIGVRSSNPLDGDSCFFQSLYGENVPRSLGRSRKTMKNKAYSAILLKHTDRPIPAPQKNYSYERLLLNKAKSGY